jgi:hypothetical protein
LFDFINAFEKQDLYPGHVGGGQRNVRTPEFEEEV